MNSKNTDQTATVQPDNAPVTCVTWKSGGVTDEERIANLQFSLRNEVDAHVKAIKRGDHYKAHADKLAEALRDCITTPGALAERTHEYALRRLASISATATEALAAYESEVQQ